MRYGHARGLLSRLMRRHAYYGSRKYNLLRPHRALHQAIQIPAIFVGLSLTLWAWKCVSLVIFQNKVIYMGYIGRSDKLTDYPTPGVCWSESAIKTPDSETLALLIGRPKVVPRSSRHVTLVYLQGNAGCAPARLPLLSRLICDLASRGISTRCIVPSYRGYWRSTGSPSEAGILIDIQTVLDSLQRNDSEKVILWGHSIGAGFAVLSVARSQDDQQVAAVVLETPFTDTTAVLKNLYPQKWLPYHYLGPWLRTRLDVPSAMARMATKWRPRALVLEAEKDEIVPASAGSEVLSLLTDAAAGRASIEYAVIRGALHQDVLTKSEARRAAVEFIVHMVKEDQSA